MGQFKDGLDLTAIREVKYLQELRHPNVIEVYKHDSNRADEIRTDRDSSQLIDVFSHKTNLNLVLEYLDSDLEQVIKDKSILFMPADIKSWMLMMLRGLDHCHRHFVLHRVSKALSFCLAIWSTEHLSIGYEAQQFTAHKWRCAQDCRFWFSKRLGRSRKANDISSGY